MKEITAIFTQNMKDMIIVRKTWDPYGGRLSGTRSTGNAYAEFWSAMDGALLPPVTYQAGMPNMAAVNVPPSLG